MTQFNLFDFNTMRPKTIEKQIDEKKIREFIEHLERRIYPYDETHDQKRVIKTVITELDTLLRVNCH